jgi:MraZ protein
MSIPSDFRRVLEANDPAWTEGLNPSLYLLYGDHLKDRLEAYTVGAFDEVARQIMAIKPRTAEENLRKQMSQRMILGQSVRLEVDRDGRIVMPIRQRQKLGLTEGEVVFSGAGDHFEIWAAKTYEDKVAAETRAFLEAQGEGFDPMTLVWGAS